MSNIQGSASLPSSFKYQKVYEKGKPVHDKSDSFSFKHPSMDLSRRAKIFNPFDALKGFDDELLKSEQAVIASYTDDLSESIDDYS